MNKGIVLNTSSKVGFAIHTKLEGLLDNEGLFYCVKNNDFVSKIAYNNFNKLREVINDNSESVEWHAIEESVGGFKSFLYTAEQREVGQSLDEKVKTVVVSGGYDPKDGELNIAVYSNSEDAAKRYILHIAGKFEHSEHTKKEEIEVNFWSYNGKNGTATSRDLRADDWENIAENYSKDTRENFESLLENFLTRNGKLIVFAGPPGVGKTTLIRALVKKWDKEVACQYIIDPETFFNGPPNYMMDLILNNNSDYVAPWEEDLFLDEEKDNRKRLLVLEDCGELITSRAKLDIGQGLSRFMNVVDGMIGQGLDLAVLLTTNEKIENFHEAVVREGRINTMIDFEKFSIDESRNWLESHGVELSESLTSKIKNQNGLTLAECYDCLHKDGNRSVKIGETTAKKPAFGFAA